MRIWSCLQRFFRKRRIIKDMRPSQFDAYYKNHTDKDKVYKGPQFCQCSVCFKPFIRHKHYGVWKGYFEYCSKECRRIHLNIQRNRRAYIKRKNANDALEF